MLKAALEYARLELYVFPLHNPTADGQCSCGNVDCRSIGKHPRTPDGVGGATIDAAVINRWWRQWPEANIGVACGPSNLLVIDIDPRTGGDESWEALRDAVSFDTNTAICLTGSGGQHYYYRLANGTGPSDLRGKLESGVDVKLGNAYVVVPPSLHRSGHRYAFEPSSSPTDAGIAPLPEPLLSMLKRNGKVGGANKEFPDVLPDVMDLATVADHLNTTCISNADDWLAQQRSGIGEGATPESAQGTTHSTNSDNPRHSAVHAAIHSTDLGNARRLVEQHGENLRYCHAWGSWVIWEGQRWVKDETGEVQRLARQTVAEIYAEASMQATVEDRQDLAQWAIRSESRERLKAMVDLAKDEPGIPIRHTELDFDPWLFNVANGTLDLRTGELRPHQREDLITKMSPVVYDPRATCPRWMKFLRDVLPNPELRAFISRAIGYSLTGVTSEQCLFFAYGRGRNGKTTFSEMIKTVFGDYAQKAPIDMLMLKRGSGIPNDVARLPGARFVVASEIEQGRRLAESLVKDLTGGDTLTARFMRQEFFEFEPTHKLWMYGNHRPEIRGTDDGIWRRIHLIPFEVKIPKDQVDRKLLEKLKDESSGILAWAVRGCLDWQEKGLGIPNAVAYATSRYRSQMDVLGRFLDECCCEKRSAWVTKGELHDAFVAWGGDLGKRRFGNALRERGFLDGHGTGNVAIWRGLGLKQDKKKS